MRLAFKLVPALAGLVLAVAAHAGEFTIGAADFDRGNVRVSLPGQPYAGKYPCIWNGGKYPNQAEYDIEFPVTAEYSFEALYAAADSRPVDIYLDGQKVHTGFASITGGWDTSHAKWEKQCTIRVTQGKHTVKLQRQECMPHICAFRMTSSTPFPPGWKLVRAVASSFDWREVTSQFTIDAHEFDRSNLRVSLPGESYAGRYPCVWNAEKYPNQAEYEIEFPVTADYTFHALYTAAGSRPVDIYLDGQKLHTGFASVTGDWNTNAAKWEKQCTFHITQGTHVIKLERRECIPHICAFRLESSAPFPDGWRLKRPGLEERRKREAKQARLAAGLAALELIDGPAMRRALDDLAASPDALSRLESLEKRKAEVRLALQQEDESALKSVAELQAVQREILLANPLFDFDRLLVVKRSTRSPSLGLPANWQSNCVLPRSGFDDEIAVLAMAQPQGPLATLYKPAAGGFVGDVDLHFDADRLLFSSIGTRGRWHVFELALDDQRVRQVTPDLYDDVDDYDACYLPDGRIIFSSTRTFAAVPCVNGSTRVANLFIMNADGEGVRLLCHDQEHNWCPTVMNDGRILYTRWEYTDTPHTHSRLLFRMNPDGTGQMEFSGSNSYWPNSMFYTRPIPGHPTKVVTIVSGHHGVRRMGELVILDPAKGRHEADGVVQRIPGHGRKVEPLIEDNLVDNSWPKFLHPHPLSEKYFLVACQPSAKSLWGIYLVDVFDNLVLLREEPGYALLEPIPLRKTPKPPTIPNRVDPKRDDCVVQMTDVYRGPGLAGVPRGTVKRLRLFSYTYDYPGMGGPQGVVGMEGPWDIRRILGTVPVEPDGSAAFRAPANTPIAVQPLDADGKALQVMRSWFTGMPGEAVTCVGCHERQNETTPNVRTLAALRPPREITPWRGPARGYSFAREVQPVLDKYCLGCHDPTTKPTALDLRGTVFISDYDSRYHHGGRDAGKFSVGYANLQRFVRRPGLESDYHVLTPLEFHVSTIELYQMLEKGHHGVRLDEEAWDRLITWMDLNAPYHGSWLTIAGEERVKGPAARRREMLRRYAALDVDMEWTGPPLTEKVVPVPPATAPEPIPHSAIRTPKCDGWPFDADEAKRRQQAAGPQSRRTLDLGDGVTLSLALIPAGEFVMGSPDEGPLTRVRLDAFWMGQFEVTNEQYARFDPAHDSRVEIRHGMQFGVQGWPLNRPEQPAVRVSWQRAMDFCQWLSQRAGQRVSLPTEAQWEYACRAGADTSFHFGDADADFSKFANLADVKLRDAVSHPYKKENVPLANPSKYDDWIPRDTRFNDGELVSSDVGKFQPNAWGLHDMHGNVWEWTLSAADGRNEANPDAKRIVRGGSWRDRPFRASASFRLAYQPYQRVFNVGFRVVCPLSAATQDSRSRAQAD
ncbi:MAG: carbohydrate-binding protein [Planctomycetes bacterium]|nr:carbohydrate-binding protein [Planctomycetota bacterium]